MNNIIASQGAPLRKDIRRYRRYSNASTVDLDQFKRLEDSDDYSNLSDAPSSSSFDWNNFLNSLFGSASSVLTSIYGKGDTWRANAVEWQLNQEKRTNAILWVVIGLMVALGVYLVIRKNK